MGTQNQKIKTIENLVGGLTYKVKMFNDAVFGYWTPSKISWKEATKEILNIANAEMVNDPEPPYSESDILNKWIMKGNQLNNVSRR